MNIVVYGAGAIGGYLGVKLAEAGHVVALLARPAAVALLNAEGIRLVEAGSSRRVLMPAFGSPAALERSGFEPELAIMGMKSYDVAAAVEPLAAVFPALPMVLGTQNGIGVETPLLECFGPQRVIAGVLTIPISKRAANELVVERANRGMSIAPTAPGSDIGRWVRLLREAGIHTQAAADYRVMKWSKALLNMVGNASSAILNRSPAELYRSAVVFRLEIEMLREALAVMHAQRLSLMNLPGAPARPLAMAVRFLPRFLLQPLLVRMLVSGRGEKMPSFHIDRQLAKERSEVIYHNGAVAQAGQDADIATPVNRGLNDILLKLMRHQLDALRFDGNPAELAAEIARYR